MNNPLPFKLHNIELSDGTHTRPGYPLWKDTEECKQAVEILNSIYKPEERSWITVADLGCGEGGYAIEFARHGYQVSAIDARQENIHRVCFARAECDLHIPALIADVKDIKLKNLKFDVIFCSGLLYHLDKPVEFIHMLSGLCNVLILNTHFARITDQRYDTLSWLNQVKKRFYKRLPWIRKYHFGLSKLTFNEGAMGRWYREYHPQCSDVEKRNWAAYSNDKSFWLTTGEIRKVMEGAGFTKVTHFFSPYPANFDRRFFLGKKAIVILMMALLASSCSKGMNNYSGCYPKKWKVIKSDAR